MTVLLLLALLLQSPGADQECSISGRVLNASTGAPLKNAQLRLFGTTVNARPGDAASTTDVGGGFHFEHLAAGQYIITADRTGYLTTSSTRTDCGSTDVSIKMTPQGMIYGRVIDDDGDPVANANVNVYQRAWIRGQRQLTMFQNAMSQADGTFVLGNLKSGAYYMSVRGNLRPRNGEMSVENFFPNTPDLLSAIPVTVTAGTDIRGLDLRVRSARSFSIRGTAVGPDGSPVHGVPLMLMNTNSAIRGGGASSGTSEGAFEFRNVAPGNYVIQTLPTRGGPPGNPASLTAHVLVSVGSEDVQGVEVPLIPGSEITGAAKLESGDSFSQPFSVSLEPVNEGINNNAQARNGSFALHMIAPTLYRVVVLDVLDGYYVKSIQFAGHSLNHRELDLSSGASGALELLFSAKPATISGTVRNADGDPAASATVNVWAKDDIDVRQLRTDASGHFTTRNLAPGEYHIIAWESLENGVIQNPVFRASLDSRASVVTLQESSQENVDLKLVPKSTTDQEIAKLP